MNVLCINPDLSARMRFKSVAQNISCFSSIHIAGTLGDGMQRAKAKDDIDAIYISHQFAKETVKEFIASSKKISTEHTAAHLLILSEMQADRDEVASFALLGLDGFLLEPYSAEGLQNTANLANKIKIKNEKASEKMALDLLMPRLVEEIDRSAMKRKGGPKANKALKDLAATIHSIPEHLQDEYFDRLIALTENLAAPVPVNEPLSEIVTTSKTPRRITIRK